MTTLDDVERSFDAETVLVCDRDGPSGIAGIMGGQVSEVSEETTRVLLEVANWNGTNILRTSRMLGAALRGLVALREAAPPRALHAGAADRLAADGRALRRQAGAGDDRRRRRDPASRSRSSCAASGSRACSGWRSTQADQVAYLERLGFGVEADGEDLEVDGAARPPLRRHPRGRPDRGGRRASTASTSTCPATLPGVAGQVGGLSREQRLRRRAEDAMRDLGFDEIVGWSFTDPGEPGGCGFPPTTRGPTAIVLSNPLSEEQSVMRTTLLGSLLDVARAQPRPRRRARRPLRVGPRLPAAERPPGDGRRRSPAASPASGRRRPSRTGSAASRSARSRRRPGAASGEPADFFAAQGRAGSARRPARRRARRSSRPSEPFLHPGPLGARSLLGGEPAGWIGELHPLVCRAWDLDGARSPSSSTWRRWSPPSTAGEETYEDVTTFPAVHQDLAVVVADEVAGRRRCARPCSRAAASCCARPRSSTSTRASRSARAARASRCGSSSAPPTARSPTRRSPSARDGDRGRAGGDRRVAP